MTTESVTMFSMSVSTHVSTDILSRVRNREKSEGVAWSTYCPAAAWSKLFWKLSLSRFWPLKLSDLEDDGIVVDGCEVAGRRWVTIMGASRRMSQPLSGSVRGGRWVERPDRGGKEKKEQNRSGIYHIMPCHTSQHANPGQGLCNATGRIGH